MKNPFRFWMTSGVAIMVASVSGGRRVPEEEHLTLTCVSRFGVSETLQRIEASAQRHGMHVLACLPQSTDAPADESRFVIVLESSQGGTPVQMTTADAQPDLLLSVVIRKTQTGRIEVFLHESALRDLPEGLSAQVQHDLADLPAMVEEALAA